MLGLESNHLKAPFFAYSHIPNWTEEIMEEEIQSVFQLESYLERRMKGFSGPFMFKLTGIVKDATIHVMYL
jgi:acetolactate decarboxylase